MKISTSWLSEWAPSGLSARELGDRLTMAGFELESIAPAAPPFEGVIVAEIVSATRHPQADKLQVCTVVTGESSEARAAPLQIVCGAANARAGLRTALAVVGAKLPGDLNIKAAKLRGVESAGMLCSAKELGLAETSDGIVEFPSDAPLGASVREFLSLDDEVLELLEIWRNAADPRARQVGQVLHEHYVVGIPYREIAEGLGCSVETVYNRRDEGLDWLEQRRKRRQ